jgi:hypothetical protein
LLDRQFQKVIKEAETKRCINGLVAYDCGYYTSPFIKEFRRFQESIPLLI